MARGKNKAIAERRSVALSEIGTIDALRLRVKNLEEELADVKGRFEEVTTLKNQNITELNQRLKENTSSEVEELREIVLQLRNDLGESRQSEEKTLKKWHKLIDKVVAHFEVAHRMDRLDVFGTIVKIEDANEEDNVGFENAGDPILIADKTLIDKIEAGSLTRNQVKVLQKKKRGF